MFTRITAGILIGLYGAALSTEALSGISEDIVFCSKIASVRERIACYDAAARLADKKENPSTNSTLATRNQTSRKAALAIDKAPRARDVATTSRFQGAYVVALFGYSPSSKDGSVDFASVTGPSIGFGIGYNVEVGALLTGVEGRFRYDMARKTDAAAMEYFERRLGGDLSWRFGIEPIDWLLLYGRAGVGVQEFFYSQQSPQSPTRSNTSVSPYLVLGTGLEANFNSFFLRLEGEFETYVGNVYKAPLVIPGFGTITFPPQRPYSMGGTLGAGVRF